MSSKWHGEIDVGDCRSILTRYIDQSHHHDNEVFYAHAKMKKDMKDNPVYRHFLNTCKLNNGR